MVRTSNRFWARAFSVLGSMATFVAPALAADITIGQIAQLTGFGAQGFGRPMNWGSTVAIDEISHSGLFGGTQVKLVVGDDASDPTVAITEFNKMVRQKISIVTVGAISKICSAVDPVAKQSPVFFACIATGVGTMDTKPPYVSLNEPGEPMASLARYVIAKNGAKKIALVFDIDNAGAFESVSAGFLAGAKSLGVDNYISIQNISQKDTDFSSMLTNLKQVSPDAIVFLTVPAQAGNIILQMAQMGGFEHIMKVGHVGWTGQVPQIAGPAATGALFVQAWIPDGQSKSFIDAYNKLSNGSAPTAYSALGHDAIWLLAIAAKLAIADRKETNSQTVESKLTAAFTSDDFKSHALIKGLTFNSVGRAIIPGIVTTFDDRGSMTRAP